MAKVTPTTAAAGITVANKMLKSLPDVYVIISDGVYAANPADVTELDALLATGTSPHYVKLGTTDEAGAKITTEQRVKKAAHINAAHDHMITVEVPLIVGADTSENESIVLRQFENGLVNLLFVNNKSRGGHTQYVICQNVSFAGVKETISPSKPEDNISTATFDGLFANVDDCVGYAPDLRA